LKDNSYGLTALFLVAFAPFFLVVFLLAFFGAPFSLAGLWEIEDRGGKGALLAGMTDADGWMLVSRLGLDAEHLIFWRDRVAKDIQPQEIQAWLDRKSVGIRSKLRNEMSGVYRHGQATGLIPRSAEFNPMSLVSAPTRSDFESVDLSPTECSAILEKIEEPMGGRVR
jgi:hypothetical protein